MKDIYRENHFNVIADIYDNSWSFSNHYQEIVINQIIKNLNIKDSDILLDIGGGTGRVTSTICKSTNLKKAYCIEPSKEMCKKATFSEKLEIICDDAHSFIENTKILFTKVLFKEMIHHLHNRTSLYKQLHKKIQPNGKLLIITRPKDIKFPLFQSAKEKFKQNQPDYRILMKELQISGFENSIENITIDTKIPLKQWLTMVKNRFMSDLSDFSNIEILEGIKEIKKKYSNVSSVTLTDELIFITSKIKHQRYLAP